MQKYANNIQDRLGNARAGVSVTVNVTNGGIASLFQDAAGLVPQDNPIRTDSNGYFEFYVADGTYDILVNGNQGYTGVQIVDVVTAAQRAEDAEAGVAGAVKKDELAAPEGVADVGFDPTLPKDGDKLTGALFRERTKFLADKPYFGDQTGVQPIGPSLKAAIESLSAGETLTAIGELRVPANTSTVINVPDNVDIDLRRATLNIESLGNLIFQGGSGGQVVATTLANAAARMAEWIDVADASSFTEGDLLTIQDNTQWLDLNSQFRVAETARVREVSGNRVYMDSCLLCSYTAGSVVSRYKTSKGVRLALGEVKSTTATVDGVSVLCRYFDGLAISTPTTVNAPRFGIYVQYCSEDRVIEPRGFRPGKVAAEAGYLGTFGYSISHAWSCYSRVINGIGARGWHVFEAATGQRDITYINCFGMMNGFSFSTHEGCVSARYENCQSLGKLGITNRSRYLEVFGGKFEASRQQAIAISANSYKYLIDGVHFVGNGDSTAAVYSDATAGTGRAGQGLGITGVMRNCTLDDIHRVIMGAGGSLDHCIYENNKTRRFAGTDGLAVALSAQKSISHRDNSYTNVGGSAVVDMTIAAGGHAVSKANTYDGVRIADQTFVDIHRLYGAGTFWFEEDMILVPFRFFINNTSGAAVSIGAIKRMTFGDGSSFSHLMSATGANSIAVGLMEGNQFGSGGNMTAARMGNGNVTVAKQLNDYFAQHGTLISKGLPAAATGLPSGATYLNAGVLTVVP